MFKEKRLTFFEKQQNNTESSKESNEKNYNNAINKFNKLTRVGKKLSEKAANSLVKEGENPTEQLALAYDKMEKLVFELQSNKNPQTLHALNNAFETYEDNIYKTQQWVEEMESIAKRNEKEEKMEKEKPKSNFEKNEKAKIKEAEDKIKELLVKTKGSKSAKKQIQEAIYDLSQFINSDDPRNELKYWNIEYRNNKESWEKTYS